MQRERGGRGIGPAPAHFKPDALRAWEEIVRAVVPGTLIESDRYALEIVAHALARFRRGAGADEVEHARLKVSVRESLAELLVPEQAIDALMAGGTPRGSDA